MKIYTRTGDDGTTALIGGDRTLKSDPSIESYGTVDELNASLGLAASAADSDLITKLQLIQAELFIVGSHLATPPARLATAKWIPALTESSITRLELEIDDAESHLPPLKNFILPGGSETAARLHLSRTICRRAERLVVPLDHPSAPAIIRYLNRLSDWLFVHARLANHRASLPDIPWLNQ
ncbi:MAG TPA: cob(I)yrinic acid a,c-diamide adenosyltransferase [Tepidisphaeraceae bacterium]|jgi:cob(I)alamin adenosyltransferase|nr:cob(I)yrinic acid a,c-diamide adenosyltransferase [Tepidisphaeraceae bacterium]